MDAIPPLPARPSGPFPRTALRVRAASAAAGLAAAAALAATFSLYVRPGVMLDFGQLMMLCGFR